jgi:hypothetical protein
MKQTNMMRFLAAQYGHRERIISEYAAAELRGEVGRKSNKNNLSAEAYACRLYYNVFERNPS